MKRLKNIPKESLVLKNFGKIDYWDAHEIKIEKGHSVDAITKELFKVLKWVDVLIDIRDFIVTKLGLKAGKQKMVTNHSYYEIGANTVYLEVLDRNENEIVVFEDDNHLNLRMSILIEKGEVCNKASFYTLVQYNNNFGKFYFSIVRPFHRQIKKTLIKKNLKQYTIVT